MHIEAFWAKGYRSLRDVRLDPLGSFNVFYGPNGSGKSNVLAAIQTLFRLLGVIAREPMALHILETRQSPSRRAEAAHAAAVAVNAGAVARRDLHIHSPESMTLGARLRGVTPVDPSTGRRPIDRVKAEITLEWTSPEPRLWISAVEIDGTSIVDLPLEADRDSELTRLEILVEDRVWGSAFCLIDAIRALHVERDDAADHGNGANVLLRDMNEGRLASALFAAKNASDPALRSRFRALQTLLQGDPLRRPTFDVLRDVVTKEITIRERLTAPDGTENEIPLDLAGLGVVQIYTILAKILFAGTAAAGIEEPEAHLHAPTSGLALRELLRHLVTEGRIEQLFIATHSNLFDLDPGGYFDVGLDNTGATVIKRSPNRDVDRHFYEPGPTLHALEELLTIAPADKIMFRRPDGTPVTAREMLDLLRGADPTALEYLRNLHAAAVDVVGLRSRKGSAP